MYSALHNITTIQIRQIKEKFGSLRFYYTGSDDLVIGAMVTEAEEQSEKICEKCGNVGCILVADGKWYSSCKEHTEENSLTPDAFIELRNANATARTKCEVCETKGAIGYWTGTMYTNRCEEHNEDFITTEEYFSRDDS